MLILLSDLHFMDGTAGVDNLPVRIYERMLSDMAAHAREARAKEVKIALLGDIFDLIRTERWFAIPAEQRPWGSAPSETAVLDMFDAIVERNAATFEILSGSLADQFDFPAEPERIYVPGNHDRLCNVYPSMRRRVRAALGMAPDDEPFPLVLLEPDYGVYGRHGHEFDPYNYEGAPVFGGLGDQAGEQAVYAEMPIGDVIACEFASKLPVLIRRRAEEAGSRPDTLVAKFRELFDVRPLASIVDWLELQRMKQPATVEALINDAMRECAASFNELPFVRGWFDRNDDWGNPFDDADKLQMLFGLLRRFGLTRLRSAFALARGGAEAHEAHYPEMAQRDFAQLDLDPELRGRILYAIFGHTHQPLQTAVGVIANRGRERHRVYINTGTWRPSHRHTLDDAGFARWNNLTTTYVYRPGEITGTGGSVGYPSFETWTGAFG